MITAPAVTTPGSPVDVLIAEDSPTQARRLAHILEQRGFRATAATNGREALEIARRLRPALVISDVVMPEVDGYTLTRRLKSDPDLGGVPVILVTSMSDPQDVIRGLECGADCFILKPYDEDHLVGRIQYILLNRQFRRVKDAGMGVEIHFNGQRHYITADRLQILDLLLSTYDAAIQRNQELSESKQSLEATAAEVRAGHRFLDSMIENMPVPILVQDAQDLRYVRINRAAEELFGCTKADLEGHTAYELLRHEEAELFVCEGRRVLRERTVQDIPSMTVTTRQLGLRHLHTKMVPVLDAIGEPSHLLVMCDDITENVKAAEALKALNEELMRQAEELERARAAAEEGTRAKSAFLAAMSHEIRTPMNGVIGMVDVLHQSSLRGDQVEMVDLIRDSANALLAILEDILDFSKIEAGKLEIESAPMSVEEIVERACGLLDSVAQKKGVVLTLAFDTAIPALVRGDALRVRQVLINLISNAIKFSSGEGRQGRVQVSAWLDEGSEPPRLAFAVRDNGIGIDDRTRARLFNSFEQADVSTTRRFGGTGLGLAISHRLATLMGGDIQVRSVPGQGATFIVHLPCRPVGAARGAEPVGGIDGLRCLVVGSDELARSHLAYLAYEGVQVEGVADLAAARDHGAPPADGAAAGEPPLLWLIECADVQRDGAAVLAAAEAARGPRPAVLVAVEAGRRLLSCAAGQGWVELDGHVLSRRRFVQAIAAAMGWRARRGVTSPTCPTDKPLARAEAIGLGRLVLVAEDNETNQKVVQRQLTLLGIASDIAGDGVTALRLWREGRYAAVLTDVHMPVMDGYALTAAIRAEEHEGRRTRILGLSANAAADEAQRCRASGMDDYLSKPVRLQRLRQVMDRWLPPVPRTPPPADAPRGAAEGADGILVSDREDGADDAVARSAADADATDPGAAPPPIEPQALEALVGSDLALVDELLQEFRRGALIALEEVRHAMAVRDAAALGATGHRLKSSAQAVGALALGRWCERLEAAGEGGDWDALDEAAAALEVEIGRVTDYLQAL